MISLFVLGLDGEVSGDILRMMDILIQESRAQRVPAEKTSKNGLYSFSGPVWTSSDITSKRGFLGFNCTKKANKVSPAYRTRGTRQKKLQNRDTI